MLLRRWRWRAGGATTSSVRRRPANEHWPPGRPPRAGCLTPYLLRPRGSTPGSGPSLDRDGLRDAAGPPLVGTPAVIAETADGRFTRLLDHYRELSCRPPGADLSTLPVARPGQPDVEGPPARRRRCWNRRLLAQETLLRWPVPGLFRFGFPRAGARPQTYARQARGGRSIGRVTSGRDHQVRRWAGPASGMTLSGACRGHRRNWGGVRHA